MDNIIRLITTEADLDAAQEEMGRLLEIGDYSRSKDEDERLGVLGVLVRYYEDQHWALDMPDPIEAILTRMADLGLQQNDLLSEFSNKSTASLVLSRKRPLTLPVIRRLAARLTLPVAVLAQEYQLAPDAEPDNEALSATG